MSARARRRAAGFILPMTLWILAAITIVAVYLAEQVHRSLALARAQQERNDASIALSNTRAEILFRLSTQPLNVCGLGVGASCVALDDRPYLHDGTVVHLQDERGLFNINTSSDVLLDRLLALYGLAQERRAVLIDALRDYVDEDSLRRLNGAEAPEYSQAKLPQPRNAQLLSPLELRAVYGWSEVPTLWERAGKLPPLASLISVSGPVAINANTAPSEVLQTLPGISVELAAAIVQRRRSEPVDAQLVDRLAGGGLLQMPALIINFPADAVRVTQRMEHGGLSHRYNVRLTPRGARAPWEILAYQRLEQQAPQPSRAAASSPTAPVQLPPRIGSVAASPLDPASGSLGDSVRPPGFP